MKQIIAAVCDTDEQYLNRFDAYFRNHDAGKIVIHTFTKLEAFMEGLLSVRFDLILLGKGFDAAKDGLKQYTIPILFLKEEIENGALAEDCVAESRDYQKEQENSILKYQSAEAIMHEMFRMCEDKEKRARNEGNFPVGKMEIIGVYSPIQHEMQIPFSMTVASLLAEKKKVLYMNLMECTGFLQLFQLEGEYHLGDLLAKIHQKRLSEEAVHQVIYQSENLYYIPPAKNPENLYQLEKEEYIEFFGFLEKEMDFEVVVIDFGSMLTGFCEILNCCHEVYDLMKMGPFYECRKDQFMQYIETSGQIGLDSKMNTVYLPYSASQVVPTYGLIEQFKWSELGDLVRKNLFGAVENDY